MNSHIVFAPSMFTRVAPAIMETIKCEVELSDAIKPTLTCGDGSKKTETNTTTIYLALAGPIRRQWRDLKNSRNVVAGHAAATSATRGARQNAP